MCRGEWAVPSAWATTRVLRKVRELISMLRTISKGINKSYDMKLFRAIKAKRSTESRKIRATRFYQWRES